jgi:hypothetical protein
MKKKNPEGFDLAKQYYNNIKKGPEKKKKNSTMSQTFLFRKVFQIFLLRGNFMPFVI